MLGRVRILDNNIVCVMKDVWCIVCEIDYGFKVFYVKKNVKKKYKKKM